MIGPKKKIWNIWDSRDNTWAYPTGFNYWKAKNVYNTLENYYNIKNNPYSLRKK